MTEPLTPDVILRDAGLAVLPGDGFATLRVEISRNMLGGGAHLLRVERVRPDEPRRKPVNLLREAGVADVIVANDGEGAPELLEMLATALRMAAEAQR